MHVIEVIEPAIRHKDLAVGIAAKCPPHAISRLFSRDPLSLGTDAHGGKTEARYAGTAAGLIALSCIIVEVAVDEILTNASLWITSVPEIAKGALR